MLPFFLSLPLGLALLVFGANWLVDGASALAKRLGVSALVIGLTIVAFGTSAPELIVNLFASAGGNSDIAIGNVLGSNIANVLLILGIAASIFPLAVTKGTVWKEIPLGLLAVLLLAVMMQDAAIDGAASSALTRIDGLVLIAFFIIFLYYTFGIGKVEGGDGDVRAVPLPLASLLVVGGLVGLGFGGKLVVDAAVSMAGALGVSEAVIGLTIVAVGTSLPELVTSAVAAAKRNVDIAVGNVVGSNIFNVFWILGLSATVRPLPASPTLGRDLAVAIGAMLLLFLAMFVGRRHTLERWQGFGFTALYAAYVVFLVIQETMR